MCLKETDYQYSLSNKKEDINVKYLVSIDGGGTKLNFV